MIIKNRHFSKGITKKILKIGAIFAGACVAALLLHKVGSKIINQQKTQTSLANAAKEADPKEEIYCQNFLKAFKLTAKEYGTHDDVYGFLQNECYNSIRYCRENPYVLRESCTKNIDYYLMQDRKGLLKIWFDEGWIYKKPIKLQESIGNINTCERLSLNVYQESELIKKLDDFLINSGTKAFYKAARENIEWTIRHEPVIMYFPEKISPETEKSLIELILPHTRESAEGTMLGTKLATGIYKTVEPTAEDVAALIKRAEDMDFAPNLIKYLKSPKAHLYDKNGNVNTSQAIVRSIELLLDKLEALKVNV